jgi:hypothetical protein
VSTALEMLCENLPKLEYAGDCVFWLHPELDALPLHGALKTIIHLNAVAILRHLQVDSRIGCSHPKLSR